MAAESQLHHRLLEEEDEGDEEGKVEELNKDSRPPQYEMVPSSPSEASASSDEESRKKRKKKKIKESRTSLNYAATLSFSSRKAGVQKWASSSTANEKEYYFDSLGDRDNLAFGCIYRIGVARYKLYNSKKVSGYNFQWNRRVVSMEGDSDIDALDTKLRSGGRYWSAKYAAIERHKNLKQVRVLTKPVLSDCPL